MGPPGQPWAGLSGFWGFPPFLALVETVAIAVHLQDMNVVCEPVQQRPSQALGTEHLEQQLGPGFAKRHEAELIDDQQPVFCQLLPEPQQALLVPGFDELVDQSRRRDKADGEAFLTSRQTEAEGDMGFAGSE